MAKDWSTLNSQSQSEALINEVKGNLFEYLVAFELAQNWKLSGQFVSHFSSLFGGKAQNELRHYQDWLRENDPELFALLPGLAKKTAQKFLDSYDDLAVNEVLLTGKTGAVSGQNSLKECDILLGLRDELKQQAFIPISLKFCKQGAYVNTKSGGIRSFIEKYFSVFKNAETYQKELNLYLEQSFNQMAQELYEWADLTDSHLMDKLGHFSPEWSERGLPELPGELPKDAREKLYSHYYRVVGKLYEFLFELYQKDKILFKNCLTPLLGFSDPHMVQLTLFHKKGEGRYEVGTIELEEWKEEDELIFEGLKSGVSSFNFSLGKKTLQIRLKPMNKFTVSALKVNCSVKAGLTQ